MSESTQCLVVRDDVEYSVISGIREDGVHYHRIKIELARRFRSCSAILMPMRYANSAKPANSVACSIESREPNRVRTSEVRSSRSEDPSERGKSRKILANFSDSPEGFRYDITPNQRLKPIS